MRFYAVKLGDIYFTSDGTASGVAVKLQVLGADALLSAFSGSTVVAVDGTPINQVFTTGIKGKPIEIRVETYLFKPVWNLIVDLINERMVADLPINIIGTGDICNFNVDAKPLIPKPFEALEFTNERIIKPIFRFITT